MISELVLRPGFSVDLMAAKDELSSQGGVPKGNALFGMPVRAIPYGRKWLEFLWKATGHPVADRWCPGATWVYCPAEAYVPVRKALLAVTVHDLHAFEAALPWSKTFSHRHFQFSWRVMFRRLRACTNLFLTVSEFTRRRMSELLDISPDRIAVVGNGVAAEYFASPTSLSPDPYVLVVGGLWDRKGGDIVLRVARELASRQSGLSIRVAGKNDAEFEGQAANVPNIELLGHVSQQMLPELYRRATALFFPSRYEGFGIPVIEAMASLTPVVCSDQAALQDTAGDSAIIVPLDDIDSAVTALMSVREDPALRARLIASGRLRAARFRWSACADRLVAAFNSYTG
jgi:glycosyltransferase involved in cell wall biosynthesis